MSDIIALQGHWNVVVLSLSMFSSITERQSWDMSRITAVLGT